MQRAVPDKTSKLLKVRFIREVSYTTWLINVIMVKKPSGKWQMCVDFTDLNKACPKDSYPLLNIDWLVDKASGHKYLNFMDAYSRYNQNRIHPNDEEKMTFITKNANFCYKVMPFGLKKCGSYIPTTDEQDICWQN